MPTCPQVYKDVVGTDTQEGPWLSLCLPSAILLGALCTINAAVLHTGSTNVMSLNTLLRLPLFWALIMLPTTMIGVCVSKRCPRSFTAFRVRVRGTNVACMHALVVNVALHYITFLVLEMLGVV